MRSMIGFSVCSELLDELEFANDGPCTHTPPKRFQLVYEMADCHKNFQKKPNRRILVTAPCPRGHFRRAPPLQGPAWACHPLPRVRISPTPLTGTHHSLL